MNAIKNIAAAADEPDDKLRERMYDDIVCMFFMIFALLLVGAVFAIMHPFTKNVKS